MPDTISSWAESRAYDDSRTIISSDRLWEHREMVPLDDVSPDLLAQKIPDALQVLLTESGAHGRALDWSTARSKIHSYPRSGTAAIIVSVDTL